MKAKRTVEPTGLEDYDLEYLSSHLDKATTHEVRGNLVAELEIRAAALESTLGIVIRRGFEVVRAEYEKRQELRRRLQQAAPQEPEEEEEVWYTPPPQPIPTEFDVWNSLAPYKEYCRMILESGWDFVDHRPKEDPIQHSATTVRQFIYDRVTKDPDVGDPPRPMRIDELLTKQKTLLQMIIEAHSHWARTLKVVSNG